MKMKSIIRDNKLKYAILDRLDWISAVERVGMRCVTLISH